MPDAALLEQAQAKGTDTEFLDFVRRQPSALSGKFSEWVNGSGRCVAAHYRTAANSGMGYKPKYSAIPLTDAEHRKQHQVGQLGFRPRDWWEKQVEKYLRAWIAS